MTRRIIVLGLSVLAVVSCGTDSELPAATAVPVTTAPPTTTAVVTLPVVIDDNSGDVAATTTPDAQTATSPSTAPVSTSAPVVIVVKDPAVPGVVITSWTVVDGDTIKSDGQSIRILGYDTPERG